MICCTYLGVYGTMNDGQCLSWWQPEETYATTRDAPEKKIVQTGEQKGFTKNHLLRSRGS
jgi:hypothetical protein